MIRETQDIVTSAISNCRTTFHWDATFYQTGRWGGGLNWFQIRIVHGNVATLMALRRRKVMHVDLCSFFRYENRKYSTSVLGMRFCSKPLDYIWKLWQWKVCKWEKYMNLNDFLFVCFLDNAIGFKSDQMFRYVLLFVFVLFFLYKSKLGETRQNPKRQLSRVLLKQLESRFKSEEYYSTVN